MGKKYSTIIVIYIFVFLYIKICKTYEVNEVLSKEDVLKITDEYYINFYCKNDTCVAVDKIFNNPFVEIPDKKGNIITYITYTCTYDNIKSGKCPKEICGYGSCTSIKCTTDSQCLSNKCIDNFCVFNKETPIVHCDNIYTPSTLFSRRSSYMYCGKPCNEPCETDDECSSRKCCEDKTCNSQTQGPSDSEGTSFILGMYFITFIFIVSLILCFCWCFKQK
jgi:hypothetical protein